MTSSNPTSKSVARKKQNKFVPTIEDGWDIIDFLVDDSGLNYKDLIDFPSNFQRNQGDNEWYEAHLADSNGETVIQYIEIPSGEECDFSDVREHLKRRGGFESELFTVISYRSKEENDLSSPVQDKITFLQTEEHFSDEDVEMQYDLRYFTITPSSLEPAYYDFLTTLRVGSGNSQLDHRESVEGVFSIKEITESFYEEFGEIFRSDLQNSITGLENPAENLNQYTRTVVNRILFLLFVEEKGWLDDNENYLESKYEEAKELARTSDSFHIYHDFFEPLFFEALSSTCDCDCATESECTHECRCDCETKDCECESPPDTQFECRQMHRGGFLATDRVPFFNGGLFSKMDIEENVTIEELFFDALLDPEEGFLTSYKLTLSESNPSEQELVVDPEFIGRIFEMFMQSGDRSKEGAFYTPKPITGYMAKDTLKQHLCNNVEGISKEEAATLVSEHQVPESMGRDTADNSVKSLKSASVLDPAVGSGAFIIAMLDELVWLVEALNQVRGVQQDRYSLKKELVQNVYGVDINAGGVELCKFRTWLYLMQELDVDHDEFLQSNEEYALPNLGFNFFVGNSLVGDTDPTNIEQFQSTLVGGLDETLQNIQKTRTEYLDAHGNSKEDLLDEMGELSDGLESRLDIQGSGSWMSDTAEKADTSFAWCLNIPEIVLNGGFDIVIGNPPYEGQSQQEYVGDLAKHYDREYDFYKTIPGMKHDLYQKFIIRGWELTKKKGVFSYITSDTFLTIGSKQTTRALLQQNELENLVRVNENTFDATVSPAIFTLTKNNRSETYCMDYVDARNADIMQYRSLLSEPASKTDGVSVDESMIRDVSPDVNWYIVPVELYSSSLRGAFFKPTNQNEILARNIMGDVQKLLDDWSVAMRDSTKLEEMQDEIYKNHLEGLSPGDVSVLGLLTVGGQGLATANNDKYLSYLDGAHPAERVKERNDDFEYVNQNENQFSWMSRVIKPEHIADVESMSAEEKKAGLEDQPNTWVPIEKGKKEPYYSTPEEYINWSKDSMKSLKTDTKSRWQGENYFFREGIFAVGQGVGEPQFRYTNNAVIEHSGNLLTPITEKISTKYLLGVLNSDFSGEIISDFINHTVNTQISDFRRLPIRIPTEEQKTKVEQLVETALKKRRQGEEDISDVQNKIESIVREIYEVDLQ